MIPKKIKRLRQRKKSSTFALQIKKDMKELKNIISMAPLSWKILFFACFTCSIILVIVSFILPPRGSIDPSVLKAVGEILAFPTLYAAFECIMRGMGVKYTKGDTTIEVQSKDEADTKENC